MTSKNKADRGAHRATMELSFSHLRLAVVTGEDAGLPVVECRTVTWRREAPSLIDGDGEAELAAALKELVAEYKLQGQTLRVTLNGDYCVTRVVTGTTDRVASELDNLENRSNLYLSLGPGPKALGASIRAIDARHQHALLTVVNQNTLEVLLRVAAQAGVKIDHVESSLVSLARLVGRTTESSNEPRLIVNLGERGVEVGITQNGQLMLDYRPPAHATHERLAQVILSHLGRLQRYCNRHVGVEAGKLESAFLCGDMAEVEVLSRGLTAEQSDPIRLLTPALDRLPWRFAGENPGPESQAVLGALLLDESEVADPSAPNLLQRIHAAARPPLLQSMFRAFWPVAATLAVTTGLWLATGAQQWRAAAYKSQIDGLEKQQFELRQVELGLSSKGEKIKAYRELKQWLVRPEWDALARGITQCLPDDVYLELVWIDRDGQVVLEGSSKSEDGVFEFERWLQQLPLLERVTLNGTEVAPRGRSTEIKFSVRGAISGFHRGADKKGNNHGNG